MKIKFILLVISCLVFSTSCKKNGTGGSATIKGTVSHHSNIIQGATVYIKYDAKEFPGENIAGYDASYATTDGAYEITGLLAGDYYLYAVGFDSSISEIVKGGVPVKIKQRDNNNVFEATVAVTED